MIRAGIIGGAGYTAGELLRILLNHPEVEITFVHSTSQAGLPVSDVHENLLGETSLCFTDTIDLTAIDVVFLCMGHGRSRAFWAENPLPESLRVIDLAQDFRDESEGYVYGLPEWQRQRIKTSRLVANPGCFATAIQLALLPLAAKGMLTSDVHVTAITGSTGAGVKPGATTHFSWRTDNLSVYKPFEHQHLIEIGRNLALLQGTAPTINFVPLRGDFARGILASVYLQTRMGNDEARQLYETFYADAPFTHVSPRAVNLKQAVNTNKAVLSVEVHRGNVHIVSCIDNLLKGASGQAVENMNLMFNLDQTCGLRLKGSAF
ncbi:MAG: N-acetyl-gamma-glutamyl-phosphate reductase [Bacteroidaceae bacterium]|nr:N-acetyl-gamma-glutamyl-phosphate reductase [Bacteroidaceae bacterium]